MNVSIIVNIACNFQLKFTLQPKIYQLSTGPQSPLLRADLEKLS